MKKLAKNILKKLGYTIRKTSFTNELESIYEEFYNFTMIPQPIYISNLILVNEHVEKLDGDVVECGVWRGGMIAGIAALLGKDRTYHLFDSFEGLPQAQEVDGKAAIEWQSNPKGKNYFDNCTAEISYAEEAMKIAKASNVTIHKGWFEDTLPKASFGKSIALLRLDGDWYDSTMVCLKNLYPSVKKGGLVIIDDYYAWDGCSRAVHDYLSSIKSSSRISSYNNICYIIKNDE